ncbi:MAG: hypothetical protein ACRCX2_34725 [Paraclostridium sp.]
MTIANDKVDTNYSFMHGEISKRLWNTYYSIGNSPTPIGFSLKDSLNFQCDGLSLVYRRPGTIRVDLIDEPRCKFLIGTPEGESLILANGEKALIYNHNNNTSYELTTVTNFIIGDQPQIFHSNKNEFWLSIGKVYKVSRVGGTAYNMSLVVDPINILKPGLVPDPDPDPTDLMTLDGSTLSFYTRRQPAGALTISGVANWDAVVHVVGGDGSTHYDIDYLRTLDEHGVLDGTIVFQGDYLDKNAGILYKDVTVTILNPVIRDINTEFGSPYLEVSFDVLGNSNTDYQRIHVKDIQTIYTGNGTMTIHAGIGSTTTISVSGGSSNPYLDNSHRAEFFVGRLVLLMEGALYYSEVGDFSNFGTNNQNQLKIPGLGGVIAINQSHDKLLFSDGKNVYALGYQYQSGAPAVSMWNLSTLGQFDVITDGIISIEGTVIFVCQNGCYKLMDGSFDTDYAIRVQLLTQHCYHMFDVECVRALLGLASNVFYIIMIDDSVLRFEWADQHLAGTTLQFPNTDIVASNFGTFNSVFGRTKWLHDVEERLSLDWFPPYNPDNRNHCTVEYGYQYRLNVHNFLDSAKYVSSIAHIEATRVTDTIWEYSGDTYFTRDKLAKLFDSTFTLKVGAKVVYLNPSYEPMINTIAALTRTHITFETAIPSKLFSKIIIVGNHLTLQDAISDVDRYIYEENAYAYYCDGLRLNVVPLDARHLPLIQGTVVGLGFPYLASLDLLLGGSVKPHAKLSGYFSSLDTLAYDIEYINKYESRTVENYRGELVPTTYQVEFGGLEYYTGSFPSLRINAPIGNYCAFNYMYVLIR